jgi:hypothetical protein
MSESLNKHVENNKSTKQTQSELNTNKFWADLKKQLNHIKEMEAQDIAMEDKNHNGTIIDEKISQFRIDWKINVKELAELKEVAKNELVALRSDKNQDKNNILAHIILVWTIEKLIKTTDMVNYSDFKNELESNFKYAKFQNAKNWLETKDYLTSLNPFSKEKWAIWKTYDNLSKTNNHLEEFTKYSA